MEQKQAPQKTLTQAESAKYNQLKTEANTLFKTVLNLQQEKKENM